MKWSNLTGLVALVLLVTVMPETQASGVGFRHRQADYLSKRQTSSAQAIVTPQGSTSETNGPTGHKKVVTGNGGTDFKDVNLSLDTGSHDDQSTEADQQDQKVQQVQPDQQKDAPASPSGPTTDKATLPEESTSTNKPISTTTLPTGNQKGMPQQTTMTPKQTAKLLHPPSQAAGVVSSAAKGSMAKVGDVVGTCDVHWNDKKGLFGGEYQVL